MMEQKTKGCAAIMLAFIGVMFVVFFAAYFGDNKDTGVDPQVSTNPIEIPSTVMSSSLTGGDGIMPGRVDSTLQQRERDQWQADPSSKGWSDSDRDFLSKNGLSEAEARAAETILREQGIE